MKPTKCIRPASAGPRRYSRAGNVAVFVLLAVAGAVLALALLAGGEALLDAALPRTGKAFTPTPSAPSTSGAEGASATPECTPPAEPVGNGCHEHLPGESTGADPAGSWWVMLLVPAGLALVVYTVSGRRR
ncbi:hypothetical protein [Streptomyces sp. BRA346]|uniref:hypothetical protein n=1 Tax=Streptomyces sp. BRA346 TaxID=2878199 RepID=UPI0040637B20